MFTKNFDVILVIMSIDTIIIVYYTLFQEVREVEQQYLKNSIKELLDECKDIELLYLIRGLLVE